MANGEAELLVAPVEGTENVTYRRAIVTFIDILGFRSLVDSKNASQVAAAITKLQQSVQAAAKSERKRSPVHQIRPTRVHAFSDCVVRVRPIAQVDFGPTFVRELADLASIQAALAQDGVFIRGGITLDKIHSTDTIVFGPGLIRAYELEAQLAHVPRIIIDPATIQSFRARPVPPSRMRREITEMRRSVRQGEDGLWFVDYLRAAAAVLDDEQAVRTLLTRHRAATVDAASSIELASSTLPKYLWVAKYHNATCQRTLEKTSIPGITISKSELPSFERLRLPLVIKRDR